MSDSNLRNIPLCVDLDGTLIKTDSLYELFLLLFKTNPLYCLIAISWLMKSKAHFKAEITKRVQLSAESLPYNQDVIDYIKAQDPQRKILLVTGSNKKVADSISWNLEAYMDAYGALTKKDIYKPGYSVIHAISSKGVEIYCTADMKICKTKAEVYGR